MDSTPCTQPQQGDSGKEYRIINGMWDACRNAKNRAINVPNAPSAAREAVILKVEGGRLGGGLTLRIVKES
jgi:hypothetical protein